MGFKNEYDAAGKDLPMQVLVLGLCRTGTQSVNDALNQLGYPNVYHMYWVFKNQQLDWWLDACKAKWERGEFLDRAKFDEVFKGFQGTTDIPAAFFAEELIKAYPDAKIILTVRDEDKWMASMQTTVNHLYEYRKANKDANRHGEELMNTWMSHGFGPDFNETGRQAFRDHNAMVKRVAAGRDLLVYNVKEGWEPLCKFLGKAVPRIPMPHNDAWADYKTAKDIKRSPTGDVVNTFGDAESEKLLSMKGKPTNSEDRAGG